MAPPGSPSNMWYSGASSCPSASFLNDQPVRLPQHWVASAVLPEGISMWTILPFIPPPLVASLGPPDATERCSSVREDDFQEDDCEPQGDVDGDRQGRSRR